jgi:hypothetical protein
MLKHNLRAFGFWQVLLLVSLAGFSWLAMMVVHEFGHVLHAWLSGGTVERVVLHPLAISRTDVHPNPHPLVVAWGGVIWGCVLPVCLWAVVRFVAPRHAYLAAAFAGFCLIANGAYLGAGAVFPDGDDGGVMLAHGAARWQLFAFAIPAVAAGLWLWNGLGPRFGFGNAGQVDRKAAIGVAAALVLLVFTELLCTHHYQ